MGRRRIQHADRKAVAEFIERHWPGKVVFSRGRIYRPEDLEGYIECREGQIVGLLTGVREGEDLHLLTLNSTLAGQNIASGLMLTAIEDARRDNVRRIWFTTTNDNLRLMGFYQRLGFRLTQVFTDAVDQVRKLAPEIPEIGFDGISVHDELVLELNVKPCME